MKGLLGLPARFNAFALGLVAFLLSQVSGMCANTNISNLVSEISSTWDDVLVIIIAIVGFSLLMWVVKRVRSR